MNIIILNSTILYNIIYEILYIIKYDTILCILHQKYIYDHNTII